LPYIDPDATDRGAFMSAETLSDLYADELRDLWSANDQMTKVVKVMVHKAHDPELKESLQQSITEIQQHADTIKILLKDAQESVKMEHCKGMAGLVKEANKHMSQELPDNEELCDALLIAQYQRMSHYGLAGFGTAAAYAKALGKEQEHTQLTAIVRDIYKGDKYASKLAEKAELAAA
jgi:ferritin-like metal-binding protein YciE